MTRYGYDATGHEYSGMTADRIRYAWDLAKALWRSALTQPEDVIAYVDVLLDPSCLVCGGTRADARHDLRDDEPIATLESIGL